MENKVISSVSEKMQNNGNGTLASQSNTRNSLPYEKPTAKKLVKIKTTKKVFKGCWQNCNESNNGDGC